LTEPTTAKDPTTVVTAFLAGEEAWKALHKGLGAVRTFLEANRHKDYDLSRRLMSLADNHPIPATDTKATAFDQARRDLDTIVSENAVIARWADYRTAFETAFAAYREAYKQSYERIRAAADGCLAEIRAGIAYQEAPSADRDAVLTKVFGAGKVCHYAPVTLSTVEALLQAASKRSLSSLDQALVALPEYRAQVEADLRNLVAPLPAPGERIFEWRPLTALAGKRFKIDRDVDQALETVSRDLKAQIRDGFTVVVK